MSIQLVKPIGAKEWLAESLECLGNLHCEVGDYMAAEPALSEALRICSDIGDTYRASDALVGLGLVMMETGRLSQAASYLARAINLDKKSGIPRSALLAFNACVLLLLKTEKVMPAALLANCISQQLELLGLTFNRKQNLHRAEAIAKCSSMIDAEELHQHKKQAASMSLEDLTAYALEELEKLKDELDTRSA
jgi:tetratricopeptide (TPR) repeat protein